jgi:hypothetical protein
MIVNLNSYKSLQSNLFVKISTPTPLLFCDKIGTVTLNGDTYTGLGNLLGITDSTSELRITSSEITITISLIPDSSITDIINSKIKGSEVQILRALFDGSTGNFINITGNPTIRFRGYVNNLAFTEEWDNDTRTSSNTLVVTCASIVSVLENKISGRRTNPTSMKKYFPTDISMDRVPNLQNSVFDFGEKK